MHDSPQPFSFLHSNRRVISAWGGIDKLGDLAKEAGSSRPVVVMDAFFRDGALAARLSDQLRDACGTAPIFHFVPAHEPDTDTIVACAGAFQEAHPDLFVAIGGGSAMDTAKIARVEIKCDTAARRRRERDLPARGDIGAAEIFDRQLLDLQAAGVILQPRIGLAGLDPGIAGAADIER